MSHLVLAETLWVLDAVHERAAGSGSRTAWYWRSRKAGHLPLGTFDRALAKLDGVVPLQAQAGRVAGAQ